jgi:hypothetical protein
MGTYQDCEQRADRTLDMRLADLSDFSALMRCGNVEALPEVGTVGREILATLGDGYTADDVHEAARKWLLAYPLDAAVLEHCEIVDLVAILSALGVDCL